MPAFAADTDDSLDALAAHCIAARDVIERRGTSVMRQLIDLLLFEIAVAMAQVDEGRDETEHGTSN